MQVFQRGRREASMKLPLSRVAEFVSATGEFDSKAVANAYSIDSRTIKPGELFFAVKGERMDGHDFVQQALEKGAVVQSSARISSRGIRQRPAAGGGRYAGGFAGVGAAVRHLWGKPLVGMTGSTGKTTTKEAIAHVLVFAFSGAEVGGQFQ